MKSPYREAGSHGAESQASSASSLDLDLLPVFALLWVASLVRVSNALVLHERFDAEPALALVVLVVIPFVGLPTIASVLRRARLR